MPNTTRVIGAVQVRTAGLTKIYPPDIVGIQKIDLEIRKSPFGLLGPNGAGKTTLMRVLVTLLAPTEGTATINGYDIRTDQAAIRRMLGYLPEQFGLYLDLTAWEFLDYLAILHGIRDAAGGVPIAVENAMVYPPMEINKPLEGEEKEDTPCELSIPRIVPQGKRSPVLARCSLRRIP